MTRLPHRSFPWQELKYLWWFPVYLATYGCCERLVVSEYRATQTAVDALIPFCEWFVIPYVLWYFWIVFSLGYFLLRSPESFRRLQTYFIFLQVAAIAFCVLFPNRQDLRPEVFPREKLEWAARMVLEKEAKVESTAIREMREEVKALLEEK
mgnify:CR=1 FL=1